MYLVLIFTEFVVCLIIGSCLCQTSSFNSSQHRDTQKKFSSENDVGALCGCQLASACGPLSPQGSVVDIRIVTPPDGLQCESDSVYCCLSQPQHLQPQCGVRVNLTSPAALASGQSKFGEYPWQAAILNLDSELVGSGVIVDSHHIVTAAHKIAGLDKEELVVRVGDWNVQTEQEQFTHLDVRVQAVKVHPQYQPESLVYDLAVLTLSQPLRLYPAVPHVNSICLPPPSLDLTGSKYSRLPLVRIPLVRTSDGSDGHLCMSNALAHLRRQLNRSTTESQVTTCSFSAVKIDQFPVVFATVWKCWVSGWGKDAFGPKGKYQSVQKAVDVNVLSASECEKKLRLSRLGRHFTLDSHSFLCAGGDSDKDACTGDGGAPLVCWGPDNRWWLAGLVAWGVGCGLPNIPGVYVNMMSMSSWVQQCF